MIKRKTQIHIRDFPPELHGLLVDLADELDAAEIDPDSTLSAPASALIAGLKD